MKLARYRLRLLFIAIFIVSLPLAWLANERHQRSVADRFHMGIRDAGTSLREWAQDEPWTDVEQQLRKEGFTVTSSSEAQYSYEHDVVLERQVWMSPSGVLHDAFAHISVGKEEGRCTLIEAGIVGRPNMELAAAKRSRIYPKYSVGSRCLSQPEVLEAAKRYPILKEVTITYDLIRDHHSPIWPYGFHVTITLGDAVENDDRGKTLYFTAVSGLDPAQGQVANAPFQHSTFVGEFQSWGGSEWGSRVGSP